MITGIDVSYAQGKPDWAVVKATGKIDFVYAKATGGLALHGPDVTFLHNWKGLQEVGISRGAYHFFIADADPIAQAEAFFDAVGHLDVDDLPPMLDMEVARPGTMSGQQFTLNIRKFIERAETLFNRKLIVYTGGPIFNQTTGGATTVDLDFICSHDLWLSAYVFDATKFVPAAWSKRGKTWSVWQKSGNIGAGGLPGFKIAGINGVVDLNVTQGSASDLKSWIASSMFEPVELQTAITPPSELTDNLESTKGVSHLPPLPNFDAASGESSDPPSLFEMILNAIKAMFGGKK